MTKLKYTSRGINNDDMLERFDKSVFPQQNTVHSKHFKIRIDIKKNFHWMDLRNKCIICLD